MYSTATSLVPLHQKINFDVDALAHFVDGRAETHANMLRKAFAEDPIFHPQPRTKILSFEEKRKLAHAKCTKYFNTPGVDLYMVLHDIGTALDSSPYNAYSCDFNFLTKTGVHGWLFTGSIVHLGTQKHVDRFMPKAATFEEPGCFCMTELGHGSNVRALETTATYVHATREFVINTPTKSARKFWIGNSSRATNGIVFARLICNNKDEGVHAFVVPLRNSEGSLTQGVTWEECGEKLGLNGVDNGMITFSNVTIPAEYMLDRHGEVTPEGVYKSSIADSNRRFMAILGALFCTRISVVGGGVGGMKVGLALAITYASHRLQFGPGETEVPILTYSTHQKRLLPYLAMSYGFHFAFTHLVDGYLSRRKETEREMEALISGFKAYSTKEIIDALQQCRECCGGQGYLAANIIAQMRADLDVFVTFEGDNTVLYQLVAKDLLLQYRKQFASGNYTGMLSFLSNQLWLFISHKNPISNRIMNEEHLRSHNFLHTAFAYREGHLLHTLAMRLKSKMGNLKASKQQPFDIWNECLQHAVDLGASHIERIIYEQFVKAVDRCQDRGSKQILQVMCELFALSRIEKHRAFFMETGFINRQKSKRIRTLVDELCQCVQWSALDLVQAMKIPSVFLNVPMNSDFVQGESKQPAFLSKL